MIKLKTIIKFFGLIIFIGILGYLSLVGTLLFGPSIKSYVQRTSFNSIEWKDHLDDGSSIKIKMVDDLLKKHQLIGMNKNDLEDLLGKPPKTDYFKDYEYVYWLGPERGLFGIDSEWLAIKFKDGNVIKVEILRD